MKKVFCVLLLVCAGAGMSFAQEKAAEAKATEAAPKEKKNAITLDTIPLFNGFIASDSDADTFFFCMAFAYERLVAPHFSIGAELDLYPGKVFDVNYVYFGLGAAAAFTPCPRRWKNFSSARSWVLMYRR